MKIVIVGDGKVGYKLAKCLSEGLYDVVLIDSNEKKLRTAIDRLDIFCVPGDGVSAEIQMQADVPHADLVIACTSTDECNMLICLIARRLGARHTIARVRNPVYYHQIEILKKDLHLSMAVNPDLIVAGDITRMILFPDASKIETFVKGRVELAEIMLGANSKLIGCTLAQVYSKYQIKLLVCVVEHQGKILIPDGEYVLHQGDKLYITGSHKDMKRFFKLLGEYREKIRRVMLCGGGRMSYYLAKQLLALKIQVKIIERDEGRCEHLCEMLPEVTVIHGDATDHDLLMEEGIQETDALIALTGMDEENIIMSLFAKGQNVPKVITKVNEDRRAEMVKGVGIDSIVSPKSATADTILSYVKARHNSQRSTNIETLYQLVDEKVEAMEFIVRSATPYTNIPLKDLELRPNNIIACIARKNQIIIPNGEDMIQAGDSVIVITLEQQIHNLEDILEQEYRNEL